MRLNNLVDKWSVMGLPTKKYCLPTKKLGGNSVIFSSGIRSCSWVSTSRYCEACEGSGVPRAEAGDNDSDRVGLKG